MITTCVADTPTFVSACILLYGIRANFSKLKAATRYGRLVQI